MKPLQLTRVILTCSIASLGTLAPVVAQEDKPIDLEARKRSIVNLERHIGDRQERTTELSQDIINLDGRVEKRIDRLVQMLENSKDSKDSKLTVKITKEKAIEGLINTIRYYDKQRRELREELRTNSTAKTANLQADVKKFDDRVEKRIDQIITLTKSFTENENLDKYVETTRSGWGRRTYTQRRISEDWRQNRRDSSRTNLEIKNKIAALEKSMASLTSRNGWLKEQIEGSSATADTKELFKDDLAHNEEIIAARKEQMERLYSNDEKVKTQEVNRDEAHELAALLEDTAEDVREDFLSIFSKYDELKQERLQIAKLTENLAARKKWIAENSGE